MASSSGAAGAGGVENQGVQVEEPGPQPIGDLPAPVVTNSKIDEHKFEDDMDQTRVNPRRNRYPFCIVWTPIPLLT